jgi:hypothetical protein
VNGRAVKPATVGGYLVSVALRFEHGFFHRVPSSDQCRYGDQLNLQPGSQIRLKAGSLRPVQRVGADPPLPMFVEACAILDLGQDDLDRKQLTPIRASFLEMVVKPCQALLHLRIKIRVRVG